MAITQDDFKKVWASTSSVPEYTFSDADYQDGWEFVGNLPPTRAMWDTLQRRNDEKTQFLAEKTDFLSVKYSNNGLFRFGKMYSDAYCNGMATDGVNFYVGYYNRVGAGSYIVKYDNKGIELLRYTSDSDYHYNSLAWDTENGCLYALKDSSTIEKFDTDLSLLETITLGVSVYSISVDVVTGKIYGADSSYIYTFTDTFTVGETYDSPAKNINMLTFQNILMYNGHIFFAINYPNTIVEYELESGNQVNMVVFGDCVDNTYLGEIESLCAYPTDSGISLFVSFALVSIGHYYYNIVFSLISEADSVESFTPPMSANSGDIIGNVVHYVDSTSTAGYSNGTQSYPWLSLNECLMHTAKNLHYTINCVNADTTFDQLGSVYYAPHGEYDITFEGIVPNSKFRFYGANLNIRWKSTQAYELSMQNCYARIDTTDANADASALTVTARSSTVTVIGNVGYVYNSDGLVKVTGTATNIAGDNANMVFDGNNLATHALSLNAKGAGTVRFAAKTTSKAISAIIAFAGTDNVQYNDVYLMTGYGVGGTARTKYYRLSAGTSYITPTVDANANAIDFALAGNATKDVTVIATMLNGTVPDVTLTFTP